MSNTFTFSLISTTKKHMDVEHVRAVYLPTPNGELGILAGHVPLVSTVTPGIIRIESTSRSTEYAIGQGVMETDGTTLTVLADMITSSDEIKPQDIDRKKQEAIEAMQAARNKFGAESDEDYISAQMDYLKMSALEKIIVKASSK